MKKQTIHETLTLNIPDGFTVQDEKNMTRLFGSAGGERWCAANADESILLTVVWQKANLILAMLADMKAMARRNAQLTEKAYQGHGYGFGKFFSLQSKEGLLEGYSYAFSGKDGQRSAETVLIKQMRMIYNVSCVCRAEKAAEGEAALRQALG